MTEHGNNKIRACDFILKLKKIIASYELKHYGFGDYRQYSIFFLKDELVIVVTCSWGGIEDGYLDESEYYYSYKIENEDLVLYEREGLDDEFEHVCGKDNASMMLKDLERILKEFSYYGGTSTVCLDEVNTFISLKPDGCVLFLDMEEIKSQRDKYRFKRSKEYTMSDWKCEFIEVEQNNNGNETDKRN